MTREEIANLGYEELETRKAEIAVETDTATAEMIETLSAELDMIEERKLALDKEVEERTKAAEAVIAGAGKTIESRKESTMTFEDFRNSKAYVDAFANYIKTGKDEECRSLIKEFRASSDSKVLTELTNPQGGVPVPEFVESRIRTAWENDEIFSRVTKTFVKGILKVGFEYVATDADIHEEGTNANAAEQLLLGVVQLTPQTIKKWVLFSTEVLAMSAEDFLRYIYDEVAYKIVKKAADLVTKAIINAPGLDAVNAVGVAQITGVVSPSTIIDAIATLGDEARDLVFIASGQTIASVRKAALTANYAYDPFMGLTVIQKDITDFNGAIIGDLSGVQANFPEGDSVRFVLDEYSQSEKDLVKLVGRLYAAIEVVGPKMFATIDGQGE